MKSQHDYSYDYLRAFAAIMIVLFHIFQGFGLSSEIRYYLGGTYVDVFLLLSAYLLGLSSRSKIEEEPWRFIKKRGGRLIPTYYVFLSITFLLIISLIDFDALSGRQILGHYLFLNWFWESSRIANPPLPQIGHLWFMSCIILGYLSVVGWSQISRRFPFLKTDRSWIIYFVVWSFVATIVTMKVRFAVYPFTVILGFIILFFKGAEIMQKVRAIKPSVLVSLLIICNLGGASYYLTGGHNYPALIFWINLLNSFLWIACAPLIFNRTKIPRTILFISTISFEIYLIHHPFCLGAYSLRHYMPIWLASICVFAISIFGGWILNRITATILNVNRHVLKKDRMA